MIRWCPYIRSYGFTIGFYWAAPSALLGTFAFAVGAGGLITAPAAPTGEWLSDATAFGVDLCVARSPA